MRRFHKRGLAAFGVGAILLAAAGGAFAYWTQSGGGTATGTTGTTGTITITGTIGAGLFPGGSKAVTFTAANTGTSSVTVGAVSLVSVSAPTGCLVADFTMPAVIEAQAVPAGATVTPLTNSGTLTMANTTLNQDLCKSAALTLVLSST